MSDDIKGLKGVEIATIEGRFYAMDRDNNWNRVVKAYDAMVNNKGNMVENPVEAVLKSYETKDEFNKIFNWVEQLKEVDTENVEQLVSVNEENLVCREDVVKDGNLKDEVLKNAPLSEFGYFAVPKVVE